MFNLPTPHGDKLKALAGNSKLPSTDHIAVEEALAYYQQWLNNLKNSNGSPSELVQRMVTLLNEYRLFVDLNLVFDSENDFLYRQKGQLKLDNTVIEEFLPILVSTVFSEKLKNTQLQLGPTNCFSGIWFESNLLSTPPDGGLRIRSKDQDFAISRNLFLNASYAPNFQNPVQLVTSIAYVVAECKTNLDKTMFQEASATAVDVKAVVPGAKYYVLCEWLDMTPISTATTAIDGVIILRKSKRLSSNVRRQFSTAQGRMSNRDFLAEHLQNNPFSAEMFIRFLDHIHELILKDSSNTNDILERGYF